MERKKILIFFGAVILCISGVITYMALSIDRIPPSITLTLLSSEGDSLPDIKILAQIEDDKALDSFFAYTVDSLFTQSELSLNIANLNKKHAEKIFDLNILSAANIESLMTKKTFDIVVTVRDRAGHTVQKSITITNQ